MNMLNNWLPGERLDVWLARHAGRPPAAFYGFDQEGASMTAEEVEAPFEVGAAAFHRPQNTPEREKIKGTPCAPNSSKHHLRGVRQQRGMGDPEGGAH